MLAPRLYPIGPSDRSGNVDDPTSLALSFSRIKRTEATRPSGELTENNPEASSQQRGSVAQRGCLSRMEENLWVVGELAIQRRESDRGAMVQLYPRMTIPQVSTWVGMSGAADARMRGCEV